MIKYDIAFLIGCNFWLLQPIVDCDRTLLFAMSGFRLANATKNCYNQLKNIMPYLTIYLPQQINLFFQCAYIFRREGKTGINISRCIHAIL